MKFTGFQQAANAAMLSTIRGDVSFALQLAVTSGWAVSQLAAQV